MLRGCLVGLWSDVIHVFVSSRRWIEFDRSTLCACNWLIESVIRPLTLDCMTVETRLNTGFVVLLGSGKEMSFANLSPARCLCACKEWSLRRRQRGGHILLHPEESAFARHTTDIRERLFCPRLRAVVSVMTDCENSIVQYRSYQNSVTARAQLEKTLSGSTTSETGCQVKAVMRASTPVTDTRKAPIEMSLMKVCEKMCSVVSEHT